VYLHGYNQAVDFEFLILLQIIPQYAILTEGEAA
jgi:hypothetical protein